MRAEEYEEAVFKRSRPLLVRNAFPLTQRCGVARNAEGTRAAWRQPARCGRTAYPTLTGQLMCGSFSAEDVNK